MPSASAVGDVDAVDSGHREIQVAVQVVIGNQAGISLVLVDKPSGL